MADREALIESVISAWRPVDPEGRITASPAYFDLDGDDRREAFETAMRQRTLEAALDPEGLSTTARAVLDAVRRA